MILEAEALAAIILHSAKVPWAQCTGLILGTTHDDSTIITRVIPLSHTVIMSPMLEVAFRMVKELDFKMKVIGLYCCPSRDNYSGIPPIVSKISKIAAKFFSNPELKLIMLKAQDLAKKESFPFKILSGDNFKTEENEYQVKPSLADFNLIVTAGLKAKLYNTVIDFDDFLEDPSLDFTTYKVK